MAVIVNESDFPSAQQRGRKAIYDWDLWLNGEYWKLTKGVDYVNDPRGLRSAARQAAKKRGLNVFYSQRDRGDIAYICAYPDVNEPRYYNKFWERRTDNEEG